MEFFLLETNQPGWWLETCCSSIPISYDIHFFLRLKMMHCKWMVFAKHGFIPENCWKLIGFVLLFEGWEVVI